MVVDPGPWKQALKLLQAGHMAVLVQEKLLEPVEEYSPPLLERTHPHCKSTTRPWWVRKPAPMMAFFTSSIWKSQLRWWRLNCSGIRREP